LRLKREIGQAQPADHHEGQVRTLGTSLKDIAVVLATADQKLKAAVRDEMESALLMTRRGESPRSNIGRRDPQHPARCALVIRHDS
jgi:hypothetical protein